MRPEDWDRIEEGFHRLASLDPASRSAELAEVSADDPELAREIGSLLVAHDSESGLDRLTAKVASLPLGPGQLASLTGSSLGHYWPRYLLSEWWETADAALQPWVDEGRAALERLGAAAQGTDG